MRLFLKFPVKSYKNQTIVGKFIAEKTIYKNQFCPFQHYSQAWAWYLSVNQLVNLMWFYLQPKFYDYLLGPCFFITGYCKLDHSDRQTEEWNMRPDTPSKEIYLSNVE